MTIWYSVVFSLDNSKHYVYMLMMLVASMVKTKSLQEKDTFYVLCDRKTSFLINSVPNLIKHITLIIKDDPKSVLEGCKWRYELHKHVNVFDKTCCYIDVDMLCIKTTHIADLEENQIVVFPEGDSKDSNYSGDMPIKTPIGFTSGFFAYRVGFDVLAILEDISYKIEQNYNRPQPYYTLDQPYFNKALEDKQILLFPSNIISFNGNNNMPEAHFINFCGDPGDGNTHLLKMINAIIW